MKTNDNISILLVEDDEIDILNVKRAFSKNKILNPLLVAKNGADAITLLEEISNTKNGILPKVILLDINMPVINGIEFLQHIRKDERFKSLSVFVMTTSNEDSDKIEAYRLNVAGYIVKPLSFDKFMQAIKTLENYWNLTQYP